MKIEIDKILTYELQEKFFLSDDLLRFKLNIAELYEQKLIFYKEKTSDASNNELRFLDREILKNGYEAIGSRDALMGINLNHIFNADYYYTNGQKIVSVIARESDFEIGIHKDINTFTRYFYPNHFQSQFSLSNFKLQSYHTFEKVEAEITHILTEIQVRRVPTLHDSNMDYLEIMKYYPIQYSFRYGDKVIHKVEDMRNPMTRISDEIIEWLKPVVLKCCRNCKNFQYGGMLLEASDGHAGYCKYLYDQNHKEGPTNIWSWCNRFEKK